MSLTNEHSSMTQHSTSMNNARRRHSRSGVSQVLIIVIIAVVVVAALGVIAAIYWFQFRPSGPIGPSEPIVGSGNLVTEDKVFSEFTAVEAEAGFHVTITQSSSYSVSITVDDNVHDYVEVSKAGGTLHIGLPTVSLEKVTLTAEITMPDLHELRLSGGAHATVKGFTSSHGFVLDLSGGSHVAVLEGAANDLTIIASGGSHLDLADFPVHDAVIDLSGGSDATINLDGRLDADLSGGSHLWYIGEPTMGDINTADGSSVRLLGALQVSDSREMPYDTWMDAKSLHVEKNATHLCVKVYYYGNMPNDAYSPSFDLYIYTDIDRDGSDDYRILASLRGDGDVESDLRNATSDETIPEADVKVSGPVGGDYIQVEVAFSDIGNPTTMDLRVVTWNTVVDSIEAHAFTYTADNDVAINIDGDGSDWTGISPVFSDPIEGIDPSEFDLTDLYTTNNGSMLYHRFDVVGTPTTRLSGTGSRIVQTPYFRIMYDVDRDNTTGWDSLGMGIDYYIRMDAHATSYSKMFGYSLRRSWDGSSDHVKRGSTMQYESVFELALPLSDLGISFGESVDILIEPIPGEYRFEDHIPDSGYLSLDRTTSTTTATP